PPQLRAVARRQVALAGARLARARAVAVPADAHAAELPAALARFRRPRRAPGTRLLPRHGRALVRQADSHRTPALAPDQELRRRAAAAVRRTRTGGPKLTAQC